MNTKNDENRIIIPFLEGLSFPASEISMHLKDFVFLAGGLSFLTTLIILCLGRSIFCGFDVSGTISGLFCTRSLVNILASTIVSLLSVAFFVNRWQAIVFDKKSFSEAIKTKCLKKDFKAFGVVLLYLVLWLVLCIGCIALENRKAVPDWHVELVVFVGFSLFIVLALFLLLNFVAFYNYLQGGRFFAINKTFWPVFDNIYKPITWFFIYFLIFAYFFRIVFATFMMENSLPLWLNIFASDFFCYFLIYMVTAVIQLSLAYQAKFLFKTEE